METMQIADVPVRIAANNAITKRLGNWTAARTFQVRAHRGVAVLDLRSPHIPAGDLHLDVDADHATVKLLVSDDALIDDWDLRRLGRSRLKDAEATAAGGRRVIVTGELRRAEIRVHRGGVAVLVAMWSREFVTDLRRAHRAGTRPTVADPAHSA